MSARTLRSVLGAAAIVAIMTLPLVARAETDADDLAALEDEVAAQKKAAASRSPRAPEINLGIGVRTMIVPSAGLDPFAMGDGVAQLSLSAGPTLLRRGAVSIAALAAWDFGIKASRARMDESSLAMHRLGIGLESRFQLARRLMVFARVAPAAVHLRGTITDPGLARPLVSRTWSWALDATAGAAVMFASTGPRAAPSSRFWFTGEAGYGFAGEHEMTFAPKNDPEDPRKYGSIALPSLRPSGALFRLGFAVSF